MSKEKTIPAIRKVKPVEEKKMTFGVYLTTAERNRIIKKFGTLTYAMRERVLIDL
jgi:uncharacterized protein YlbG (UPF0298 family)